MLTKNGQVYKITEEEAKALKQRFNRFPIILKYLPNQYKKTNRGMRPTLSITMPLVAQKMTSDGIETWRYFETVTHRSPIGEPDGFAPASLEIRKTHVVASDENRINIELLYFLAKCSPFIENSENKDSNIQPCLVIEEKQKEAAQTIIRKKEAAKISSYLYGGVLKAEGKAAIAKAMGIPIPSGDAEQIEDEVTLEIDKAINIGGTVRDDFFKLINDNYLVEIRGIVQDAVSEGKIRYEKPTNKWVYLNEKGDPSELICRVGFTETPLQSIADYLIGNQTALSELKYAIGKKKPTFVRAKKGNDNSESPD